MFNRIAARLCRRAATVSSSSSSSTATAEGISSSDVSEAPATRKVQIAVVGSGPSGCYVADYLTKKRSDIHVDVYEKFPVPFGLLRYGVAPDHPEVKNLEDKFEEMFLSQRATILCNINIGKEITIPELSRHYTAVVVSTGADSSRSLGIPGETVLGNVLSAQQFVSYYNTTPSPFGNPLLCPVDFSVPASNVKADQQGEDESQGSSSNARRPPSPPPSSSMPSSVPCSDVVIVGNGNVAMDVIRVLASGYRYWAPTDMNARAVSALMDNRVRNIHVVARRGVEHSAFTTAEFRELVTFESKSELRVSVDPFDLDSVLSLPVCQTRAKKRLLELVHKYIGEPPAAAAATAEQQTTTTTTTTTTRMLGPKPSANHLPGRPVDRGACRVHFHYGWTPATLLANPRQPSRVGGVRFVRSDSSSSTQLTLRCDAFVKSIGSLSSPLRDVPFDAQKSVVDHDGNGRVATMPGVYCSGWCKRGANGVILHTMNDAHATAAVILEDLASGALQPRPAEQLGKFGLAETMAARRVYPISIRALGRIWNVEKERGADLGKRLEKIPSTAAAVDVAMGGKVGQRSRNKIRGIADARPDALLYLDEFLDDTTPLDTFAKELRRDMPHHLAHQGINPNGL